MLQSLAASAIVLKYVFSPLQQHTLITGCSEYWSSFDIPEYLQRNPWHTLFSLLAVPIAVPVVSPRALPAASVLSYVFKISPVSLCIWSTERFDFLTCGTSESIFIISFCIYLASNISESLSKSVVLTNKSSNFNVISSICLIFSNVHSYLLFPKKVWVFFKISRFFS